ncbi:hypothetical protein BK667_21365 [Pseudomonas frederiksbergensis]|nr:hypothetical protein BK667_21365 [Pseudomonas frederiksbergensis]
MFYVFKLMKYPVGTLTRPLIRNYSIHLDQEQLLAGLLMFSGVLDVGNSHMFHGVARQWGSGYFAKLWAKIIESGGSKTACVRSEDDARTC